MKVITLRHLAASSYISAKRRCKGVPPAAKRDLTWTTTATLKSYLKLLSVVGVSNAVNKLKIDAIAARMRQHSTPLRCLEDAEIARDMLAAAKVNDYGDDIVVESPTQMQNDALAKLQTLPKSLCTGGEVADARRQ
jgi:hypothetical protein